MNWVSILGLLALLGIAWGMSYYRRDVKLRPILWGLGLQFVLALIILREDVWSFVGMGLLGLLVILYLLDDKQEEGGLQWRQAVVVIAASLAVAALVLQLPAQFLLMGLGALLVALLLNRRFGLAPGAQKFMGALLVIVLVGWMVATNLHGQRAFQYFSTGAANFLNLSDYGARFLFGNLADSPVLLPWPRWGMARLRHAVRFQGPADHHLLRWLHGGPLLPGDHAEGHRGAQPLHAMDHRHQRCGDPFLYRQRLRRTDRSSLLIKPFLAGMTQSELLTIMVGGFATIAGGVLAGYIAMGVPAGHLVAASVMSAPAALVIGKIIFPEKEHSQTAGDAKLPEIESGGNVIEAASNGIVDGLKLAVNVGAMLIGFIALIAVVDVLMGLVDRLIDGRLLGGTYVAYAASGMSPAVGEYQGIFPGSLQTLFGTLLRPLAWLMGVPWADASRVGNLLGVKLSLNEFVAFGTLGSYIQDGLLSERAIVISTYALCGFANFSSIGIQIGGISALAPERKGDLARVGLKAMFGGALASWLTATIVGILH